LYSASDDRGRDAAEQTFFRQLGGVFGIALFGAILNAEVRGAIDEVLVRQPLSIRALPQAQRDAALDVLADAMTTIFTVAVPIALVGLAISLALAELPLRTTSAMEERVTPASALEPAAAT
jgi:hypothetical protein